MKYSVIIPVYNRPEELAELLESLRAQRSKNFEVIVVEDGSSISSEQLVQRYANLFPVQYFVKKNEGPGPARNYGFARATGEYFVIFDSDCILPEHYFNAVDKGIEEQKLDAWGGADKGHVKFTLLQRAMAYTMSSIFTTGGIRGGKKRIGDFQPRSYNMGFSRKVFEKTGGFRFDRFAEDIELSIRMKKEGFRVGLIDEAFVYHKRRTSFSQFFRQVSNFGKGRALVGRAHPGQVRLAHWFPVFFALSLVGWLGCFFVNDLLFQAGAIILSLYFAAIFVHSTIVTGNIVVSVLAIPSALIQLTGYGVGFFLETLKPYLKKQAT